MPNSLNSFLPVSNIWDPGNLQSRLCRILGKAYKRARCDQEDIEDIRALQEAGCILPNVMKPMPPFHMQEGKDLLLHVTDNSSESD